MSDRITIALNRLAYQFRNSTKFKALIESFLQQFQDLEDSQLQLLNERYINTAIGAQLDGIGEIVGVARNATPLASDDDFYRLLLKVKAQINKTAMTVDDTLEHLSTVYDASIRYILENNLNPEYHIFKFLNEEEQALLDFFPILIGLEGINYFTSSSTTPLVFNEDPDPAGLGFGDYNNANVGGNFASITRVEV